MRDIIFFVGPVGSGKTTVKTIMQEYFKDQREGPDEIKFHFINEFEHLKEIVIEDQAGEARLHKMVLAGDEETFEITHQDAYEMMWQRCLEEAEGLKQQENHMILLEHAAGTGEDKRFDQSCQWLIQEGAGSPRLPDWLLERAVFVHINTVFKDREGWNKQKSVEVEDHGRTSSRVPQKVLEGRFRKDDFKVLEGYLREKDIPVFEVKNIGKTEGELEDHALEIAAEVWSRIHEGQVHGECQGNGSGCERRH